MNAKLYKLTASLIAVLFILSSLVPATVWAQDDITLAESKVVDWQRVLEVANSDVVSDFEPGENSANPGPLIDWIERYVGTRKFELTTAATPVTGPAIARVGIYNPDLSTSVFSDGAVIVSCDGTFDSKRMAGELGTCLLVIPDGVTVNFANTGAVNRLANFNGTLPQASKSVVLASKRLAYPADCIEGISASLNDINALNGVADTNRLAKVRGSDGFYKKHIIVIPQGKFLLFWTSSDDINGKVVLVGRDPGTGQVYQAESGLLIVNGSFGAMAICSPVTTVETELDATDTVTNTATYEVSEEAMVPVQEVIDLLNKGADLAFLVDKYPNARYSGPMSGNSALFLLFSDTNPDSDVWMSVGEGGKPPFINYTAEGDIPEDLVVLMLSDPMDPANQLDYWPK